MEFENQLNYPECKACKHIHNLQKDLAVEPSFEDKNIVLIHCIPQSSLFGLYKFINMQMMVTEKGRRELLHKLHPVGDITFNANLLEYKSTGECEAKL
jgi:hypothetical protein